jgi:hypothetical protein
MRPHMLIGTLIKFWRSKGQHVDFGKLHATSSGCMPALALVCFPQNSNGIWDTMGRDLFTQIGIHGLRSSPAVFAKILDTHFPEDAYKEANGKLHIYYYSYCWAEGLHQVIQSTFSSNVDLLDAIVKSSAIPGVTRRSLLMDKDRYYFDGGLIPGIEPHPQRTQVVSHINNVCKLVRLDSNECILPDVADLPPTLRVLPCTGSRVHTTCQHWLFSLLTRTTHIPTVCNTYWSVPLVMMIVGSVARRVGTIRAAGRLSPWLLAWVLLEREKDLSGHRKPRTLVALLLIGFGVASVSQA